MGFAAHLYHRKPTGRRSAPRLRLALPAELITLDGQGRAVIENLSRSGARIATRLAVRPGNTCVLRCQKVEAFALVRWAASGHCGLAFDEPLSEEHLLNARWLDANLDQLERRHWEQWAQEFVAGGSGFGR